MRNKILAVFVFVLAVQPAVAWAEGPSGSKEASNQVTCANGTDTPAGKVYGGANGLEVCSDNNSAPDGRIIVSFDGQYAAADGDEDNGSQGNGFVRLDSGGPSCGGAKNQDASSGPGEDCSP